MQRHKTSERGIGHTKTRPPSTKKGQASILPSTGTKPSNKQNTTGYASKKDIRLKTRRNPPLTGNTRYKETHHTGIPARPGTRTQGEMATYAETKKGLPDSVCPGGSHSKEAATYSPALHCSTIGASGLNFSVRNGKRWDPTAIAT